MVELREPTAPAQHLHAPMMDAARRATAALLCLGVAVIHVLDQGGIPGSKHPDYVGAGYYGIELAGLVATLVLLQTTSVYGWLLAVGVAAGPLVGYILSRGPGLPNYTDDKGNWNEPLGVVSLIVEGFLLVLAILPLLASRSRAAAAQAAG